MSLSMRGKDNGAKLTLNRVMIISFKWYIAFVKAFCLPLYIKCRGFLSRHCWVSIAFVPLCLGFLYPLGEVFVSIFLGLFISSVEVLSQYFWAVYILSLRFFVPT